MSRGRYERIDIPHAPRGNALLPAAQLQARLIFREGKLQFVCGALSILVAVVCAVLVAVIVDHAPQIFMNMGEVYQGQIDLAVYSTQSTLNYTVVTDTLAPHGPRFHLHSPRYELRTTGYSASRCATVRGCKSAILLMPYV